MGLAKLTPLQVLPLLSGWLVYLSDQQQIGFTSGDFVCVINFHTEVLQGCSKKLWVCRIYHKMETRLWVYLSVFIAIVFTHTHTGTSHTHFKFPVSLHSHGHQLAPRSFTTPPSIPQLIDRRQYLCTVAFCNSSRPVLQFVVSFYTINPSHAHSSHTPSVLDY